MSHTFARFCVFPFIFYLCLFALGDKWTPLYLPCTSSIDNCKMQKSQYAYLLLYIRKFLRQSRPYLSIFEYKPVLWNIIWGKEHCNKLCLYSGFFFTVGSYWPHGTVNVTFSWYQSRVNSVTGVFGCVWTLLNLSMFVCLITHINTTEHFSRFLRNFYIRFRIEIFLPFMEPGGLLVHLKVFVVWLYLDSYGI